MEEIKNEIKNEQPTHALSQSAIELVDSTTEENKEASDNAPEPIDFLKRIVPEHRKISRDVTDDDVERVISEAKVLYNICYSQNGPYNGAFAMAHPQIDDQDPLRFFVTADAQLIINPSIVRHTRHTVDSKEGCYTFPSLEPKKDVQRYNKITISFQTIGEDDKLTRVGHLNLSGKEAKIFQHEMDHLDANYIYDK